MLLLVGEQPCISPGSPKPSCTLAGSPCRVKPGQAVALSPQCSGQLLNLQGLPLVPAVTPSKSQSLICSQALPILWPGTTALPRWVITGAFTFKISLWYWGSEKGLWQSEDSVHCSHCPFEDLRFSPSPPAAPLKDFMCKERRKKRRKERKKKKIKRKGFDEHQERNKLDQITVLMRVGFFS